MEVKAKMGSERATEWLMPARKSRLTHPPTHSPTHPSTHPPTHPVILPIPEIRAYLGVGGLLSIGVLAAAHIRLDLKVADGGQREAHLQQIWAGVGVSENCGKS